MILGTLRIFCFKSDAKVVSEDIETVIEKI